MKSIKMILLFNLFFFVCNFNVGATEQTKISSENIIPKNYIKNPLWDEYNNLSDEEKKKWGVIPEEYILEYKDTTTKFNFYNSFSTLQGASNLPLSFDLRNVNGNNYITPVKDQSILGLCWAFAGNALIESNILKLGLRDASDPALFSERQLDYVLSYPTHNITVEENKDVKVFAEEINPYEQGHNLGGGGNFSYLEYLYSLGFAPVSAKGKWENYVTTYDTKTLNEVYDLEKVDYQVTEILDFPFINNLTASVSSKETWNNMIKEYIYNYGSAYVATLAPQSSSSSSCYVYDEKNSSDLVYWNESCMSDNTTKPITGTHAMTIIGWDDNYSTSYCAYKNGTSSSTVSETECQNNSGTFYNVKGAWLLKNSWGKYNQYIHLAYDSYIMETGIVKNTKEKDYNNIYNYYGPVYTETANSYESVVIYKKADTDNEVLKRINFSTYIDAENTYTAYYQLPEDSSWKEFGTVSTSLPGVYSIEGNDIDITGEYVKIKVKSSITSSSYKPYNVFAFTYITDSTIIGRPYVDVNNFFENSKYNYYLDVKTFNIPTGEQVTYNIYDSNYNDLTDSFTFDNNYVINNTVSTIMSLDNPLETGQYFVDVYYDDDYIGTNDFVINQELEGLGTENSPYIIYSPDDLLYMEQDGFENAYYVLANDIDFTNSKFNPIGQKNNKSFGGNFNGNNFTISNLNQSGDYTGLFYKVTGDIYNLKIGAVNLSAYKVGGIVAAYSNGANISNIVTSGSISLTYMVGTNPGTSVYVGGLIGVADSTNISKSYTSANIIGNNAGYFVGYISNNSTISDSYNVGNISNATGKSSSFISKSDTSSNRLTNLIDFSGVNTSSCSSSETFNDGLIITNNYYYKYNCELEGTVLTEKNINNNKTYNLNEDIWYFENGYPTLLENSYTFINAITVDIDTKNMFIGDKRYFDISIDNIDETSNPQIIAYVDDYQIANTIPYDENCIETLKSGKTDFIVEATDGSHKKIVIPIYVFDNETKNKLIDEDKLIIKDNMDNTKFSIPEGVTLEYSSDGLIGTGTTIIYKIGDYEVGDFTAIVKGDVDGDGKVTSLDILKMRRHILEISELGELENIAGDIDGNGVSSLDILKVRRYILELDGEL